MQAISSMVTADGVLEHARVMNALADTSLDVDDDDVRVECALLGETPDVVAGKVRALLERTATAYRQRHLAAAAEEYRRVTAGMQALSLDLPSSIKERRELLAAVFAANPRMENAFLTLQHRELRALSDLDVASCLLQLAQLGLVKRGEPGPHQ